MPVGKVYLVGAGPGDPGLVTFRAKELIENADVLVYDYLVHPDLLLWCRRDAQKIYVGKKAGLHALPQDEIEALLVKHAKEGATVVRLKGGDPFIYGRGGEEMRRLRDAGVPFEVVPGVTAALAAGAYAGIPLTQRNTSSSLILLTGHESPEKNALQTDWAQFARISNATLAIYMGMSRLREIMSRLRDGGMSAETPAAVVQWASLGCQRSVVGTVADLADRAAEAELGSPAIIVVGEVVGQREQLGWFEHLPLFGRRIAITRTRAQTSELRGRLEELGAEVLEIPLIDVVKDVSNDRLAEVFPEFGSYDWLVFTSPNGVRFFFEEFDRVFDDIRSLGLMRIACVGEGTARAVKERHLKVECQPEFSTGEALADALIATGSLDNAKVLVITGNLNRDVLVRKLESARGIVDLLPVYRTSRTDLSSDPRADTFRTLGADAILFASSSAVESFVAQAASLRLDKDARRPLAGSIGPLTSATMKARGVPVDFEAAKPGLQSLVEALVRKMGSSPGKNRPAKTDKA
ncbi:MAG: uroporphyrinogen-III C-methyltransferase [Opitutaceae bacterium]|nr:uroporphyrinogen-III C-methyltransferase [Opitutaceae bacterium]